jgi:pyruvate/2-oxoglutarate dehydrogenase complex dihydrolipoamide dehydrogenase (E3) component
MAERIRADICVIGGGSGGLSVAAGASQMGAEVVLVERGLMGGDCLNHGCVPSKALLAAGHAAQAVRNASRFGVRAAAPTTDWGAVRDHVKNVIAGIAPHDSVERFESLGVRVIRENGRFTGPDRLSAGNFEISARRFVVATGSSPFLPPIEGLDQVPCFTNETIFDNADAIGHLVVIGGGPIGIELAQAHRHLGARVTVLEEFKVLGRDDPETANILKRRLAREGVELLEGARVERLARGDGGGITVTAAMNGAERRIDGSHLLVAVGRVPNTEGLGLEAAGIEHGRGGIRVDARLRTTNRRVFAIGDVAEGLNFTHVAGYHAGIVIRNALFRLPARVDLRAVPWVTYTAPELAQVGLTEEEARKKHGEIRILRSTFAENDRARAERDTDGFIKVVATRRGAVVGVSMVGPHAGEVIQLWSLVVARGLRLADVAGLILPYPTLGETGKRAAGSFFTPRLFSARTRRIVRLLLRLP